VDKTVTNYGNYGPALSGPTQRREVNNEKQKTWTQEFRFSNPAKETIVLGEHVELKWQAVVFGLQQEYNQTATYLSDCYNVSVIFGGGIFNSISDSKFKDCRLILICVLV
jgi:hypothetical protein